MFLNDLQRNLQFYRKIPPDSECTDSFLRSFVTPAIYNGKKNFVDSAVRACASWIVNRISEDARYQFSSFVKMIRALPMSQKDFLPNFESRSFLTGEVKTNIWNGPRCPVLFTHDIDYVDCYQYLPRVLECEEKYGIKSALHFLTHARYPIDDKQLLEIHDGGWEIALHGDTHDLDFGWKPPRVLQKKIWRSLSRMPVRVRGFRAPAHSITSHLLREIASAGFLYDSSTLLAGYPSSEFCFCYPFRLSQPALWEIPVAVEDSYLFRDLRLKNEEALKFIFHTMDEIKKRRGVLSLNFHPTLIRRHPEVFEEVLAKVTLDPDLFVVRPLDLIEELEKKWLALREAPCAV